MRDNNDTVTVRFNEFNQTAQFTADLFDATSDDRIEPISPLQARFPRQYFNQYRDLIELFHGREDNGSEIASEDEDRSFLTHEQRANLNKQNATRVLEESHELLKRHRSPV